MSMRRRSYSIYQKLEGRQSTVMAASWGLKTTVHLNPRRRRESKEMPGECALHNWSEGLGDPRARRLKVCLDSCNRNPHTSWYVSSWKEAGTQAAHASRSKAHASAFVAGCLPGDAPLRISKH